MAVFKIRTAYDERGDSPWDAIWYDEDDSDLDVLRGEFAVSRVWKPPTVRVEKRFRIPDIYVFQLGFAVTNRVRELLLPLISESAECLPLNTQSNLSVYALHPLRRVDLDDNADVARNNIGGNITVIRKYSFSMEQLEEDLHIFQVRQARGSAGRDAGFACCGVLVSSAFKTICETHRLLGVDFEAV